MDWWVAALAFLLVAMLLAALVSVVQASLSWWEMLLAVGGVIVFLAGFIDSAFFTTYVINDDALVVASQLRHFILPYRSMVTVRQSGVWGLFSFGYRKRFALSAHGYEIVLADQAWRVVSFSPNDREHFIEELLSRVDRERSKRATVTVDGKISLGKLK
jgi:hypothetical protein